MTGKKVAQLEDFISYFLNSASTGVRSDVHVVDFLSILDLVQHSSEFISGQQSIKFKMFF